MIKRIQIGDTIFTEQTTFYVSKIGKEDLPFITTSDKGIYDRQKEIAQTKVEEEGKLKQIKMDFPNV